MDPLAPDGIRRFESCPGGERRSTVDNLIFMAVAIVGLGAYPILILLDTLKPTPALAVAVPPETGYTGAGVPYIVGPGPIEA